jgi:hypothetical protein
MNWRITIGAFIGAGIAIAIATEAHGDLTNPKTLTQYMGEGGSTLDPTPPPLPWANEDDIKMWVEQTVTATPPPGGIVTMEKHWPPKYAKNDKVGEIWIVAALCKVVLSKDKWDHEMAFCVFHVDTGSSDVQVDFAIPEEDLEKYLKDNPDEKTTFTMPTHPPRVCDADPERRWPIW